MSQPAKLDLSAGAILDGRYRITQHVQDTGSTQLYFGTHLRLGRSVCIEMLDPASDTQHFSRVARRLGSMRHPNVVNVYDVGKAHGRLYLVTEDTGTTTLAEQLRVRGPMSVERFTFVAQQLLSALAYVHSKGIRHGAVSTRTVMMVESWAGDEATKLVRFDVTNEPVFESGSISKDSHAHLFSALSWIAPEQLLSEEGDHRVDIYAAGALFYELLAGEAPLSSPSFADFGRQILQTQPRPLIDVAPHVSIELDRSIRRALEKSPSDRYGTADEMWRAIMQACWLAKVDQ